MAHRLETRTMTPPVKRERSAPKVEERLRVVADATAARADEPVPAPCGHRAPDLVELILSRADEPFIRLSLDGEEIMRVRAGGTVVVNGPTGSGKSSLVAGVLIEHARHVGPAVALSLELPSDELGARIVGMQCNASWESVLRGEVDRAKMEHALGLPRLVVLDRRDATLPRLREAVLNLRAAYPDQPIMVAIDYLQIMPATGDHEIRRRVGDAMQGINDLARDLWLVAVVVSQTSRSAARELREGTRIGAQTTDSGAEAADIERWATCTLAIGVAAPESLDGTSAVDVSIGKSRMGGGDRVQPMTYCGRSGAWRIAGVARPAAEVRAERKSADDDKRTHAVARAIPETLARSPEPLSRRALRVKVGCKDEVLRGAVELLLADGTVVEVKPRGLLWTRERAARAGLEILSRVGL